jgi:Rieske Fe-S protein
MILVLDLDTPPERIAALGREVEALGWRWEASRGEEQVVIALSGAGDAARLEEALARHGDVDVIPILSGREFRLLRARRRFMAGLAGGLGLLTAAGIALPIAGFLLPPRRRFEDPSRVLAAGIGDIPENEAKLVRFQGRPVLVIHREGGRYYALSAICTHMNVCQLEWDSGRRQLLCPCHGGAFDVYGNVVQGPASVPLERFGVERTGERLFVSREG